MTTAKPLLGWREWVALPALNIPLIKAKIDTGARSSTIHAFTIEPYQQNGQAWVMFAVHPMQRNTHTVVECHALVKDQRMVSDSGGHRQLRYVIETPIVLGQQVFQAEMTLTNRDNMLFRMLLGRTAMNNRFHVDPLASYLQGKAQPSCYSG
ncbi:ATP-dependent zinc protease family protein [Methylocucumis oryzae]|uniref:Ribosomal protein S6 modification protein n=1 Tax=Methylocucumis oryzae TaxID=1632867 RepID=A0A0F3IFG9_9GAMM|nr:ATP-dependent zinc protease [Methylocucumis oryzae]KJV05442.1 ribosomal protein S6 modification protein [Methylocucumis oryzae]